MEQFKIEKLTQPLPLIARDKIEELIQNSTLIAGDRLPKKTKLAQMLGVSRITLRETLRLLEEDGENFELLRITGGYDMEIVKHLVENIGVRWCGSKEENEAAKYVYTYFKKLALKVECQKFQMLGWEPVLPPSAEIVSPEKYVLSPVPMAYTTSTPGTGVSGYLTKIGKQLQTPGVPQWDWIKYGIFSEKNEPIGYIVAREDGPAIPCPNHDLAYTAPTVIIGKKDNQKLEKLLSKNETVVVRMMVKGAYDPNRWETNVIARIPGRYRKSIIISAHHDSSFASPGAIDNAAGVEAICRLAKELSSTKPKYTLCFISFGGEEPYLFGSRYYVRDLKQRGLLEDVLLNINLDRMSRDSEVNIHVGPSDLQQNIWTLFEVHESFKGKRVKYYPPQPLADDWAFAEQRVPTIFLRYAPYPQYHLPGDTLELVDEESIRNTVSRVRLIIENIDELFLKKIYYSANLI